ncbi:alcohol oxidase [Pluteus cervinus]|uniref:Alcohol oxidase n=1 Tax=Pluteus cervinus TaxID=181527 RepID=A0ACD3AS10_9AGAR|nr:alcohol oxidase [Pluteus cervinus]
MMRRRTQVRNPWPCGRRLFGEVVPADSVPGYHLLLHVGTTVRYCCSFHDLRDGYYKVLSLSRTDGNASVLFLSRFCTMSFSFLSFLVGFAVVGVASAQYCAPLPSSTSPDAASAFAAQQFDYVIVGGGTAGLVLANRLSEDAGTTVGVIEAGRLHLNDPLIDIPGLNYQVAGDPNYDWAYSTVPQVHADGKVLSAPAGKLMGGGSAINLMAWDRGAKQEYDAWERFFESGGWNWSNLLPYLKKVENLALKPTDPFPGQPANVPPTPDFSGFNGAINASLNSIYMGEMDPYVRAWNDLGVPTISSPYSGSKIGIYNVRVSIERANNTRSYAVTGYYCPASNRPNLKFLTSAQATKVTFAPTPDANGNVVATGVNFVVSGTTYTVSAKKEVIISAGTIRSPALLENSGIGAKSRLVSLGINSIVDLPSVGENLQDHIFVPSQHQLADGIVTFDQLRNDPTFMDQQQQQYDTNHTGWFSTTDSALAFLPLQSLPSIGATVSSFVSAYQTSSPANALQQVQYEVLGNWLASGEVPQIEQLLVSKGFVTQQGLSYFSVLSGIQHPFSRGSIHINTTDPLAAPAIDPNHFSDDFDLEVLARSVEVAVTSLTQTKELSPLIVGQVLPPPDMMSIDALKKYAKASFGSGSHLIGTCAMASRDLDGVVDNNLKVYGTSNLRVVDASIMPLHISAHLQATIYAIGEKVRDALIRITRLV